MIRYVYYRHFTENSISVTLYSKHVDVFVNCQRAAHIGNYEGASRRVDLGYLPNDAIVTIDVLALRQHGTVHIALTQGAHPPVTYGSTRQGYGVGNNAPAYRYEFIYSAEASGRALGHYGCQQTPHRLAIARLHQNDEAVFHPAPRWVFDAARDVLDIVRFLVIGAGIAMLVALKRWTDGFRGWAPMSFEVLLLILSIAASASLHLFFDVNLALGVAGLAYVFLWAGAGLFERVDAALRQLLRPSTTA